MVTETPVKEDNETFIEKHKTVKFLTKLTGNFIFHCTKTFKHVGKQRQMKHYTGKWQLVCSSWQVLL